MKHAALAAIALGLSFGLAPVASAQSKGRCYVSPNNTHICYIPIGKRAFSAAITDGSSVKPTVLTFHCERGWRSAGLFPKESLSLIALAICRQTKGTSPPSSAVRAGTTPLLSAQTVVTTRGLPR